MRMLAFLAVFTLVVVGAAPARASISYTYSTDAPSYSAETAGQAIPVTVYFNESLTSGSTSFIVSNVVNNSTATTLSGIGVGVVASKGNGQVDANSINFNAAAAPTGFAGLEGMQPQPPVGTYSSSLAFIETIPVGSTKAGVYGNITSKAGGSILIGSFNVIAGAAGTTTTYTVETAAQTTLYAGTNTTTKSGVDLESDGTSGAYSWSGSSDTPWTFTVTTAAAVPEPGSMALCGMAAFSGALAFYRRRKAQKAASVGEPVSPA